MLFSLSEAVSESSSISESFSSIFLFFIIFCSYLGGIFSLFSSLLSIFKEDFKTELINSPYNLSVIKIPLL
ncbi:hypothetical protein LbFV_ORF40 [Leptopilina boulardi filamentous virus]|uniref:Uncharacterized protein n=1 Tax=Leptopilina boulardi filamentous virus TaxID=552509 RepID=A0A1S5YD00_9VIRU|nr:hypothetical protein LbFV_ORF40 [Leptopilina boulardi filamentous virus]AQQ79960.1 hypothetical protein LbFV_ORF40 [Leptopilina boulardi filamentous virus]